MLAASPYQVDFERMLRLGTVPAMPYTSLRDISELSHRWKTSRQSQFSSSLYTTLPQGQKLSRRRLTDDDRVSLPTRRLHLPSQLASYFFTTGSAGLRLSNPGIDALEMRWRVMSEWTTFQEQLRHCVSLARLNNDGIIFSDILSQLRRRRSSEESCIAN